MCFSSTKHVSLTNYDWGEKNGVIPSSLIWRFSVFYLDVVFVSRKGSMSRPSDWYPFFSFQSNKQLLQTHHNTISFSIQQSISAECSSINGTRHHIEIDLFQKLLRPAQQLHFISTDCRFHGINFSLEFIDNINWWRRLQRVEGHCCLVLVVAVPLHMHSASQLQGVRHNINKMECVRVRKLDPFQSMTEFRQGVEIEGVFLQSLGYHLHRREHLGAFVMADCHAINDSKVVLNRAIQLATLHLIDRKCRVCAVANITFPLHLGSDKAVSTNLPCPQSQQTCFHAENTIFVSTKHPRQLTPVCHASPLSLKEPWTCLCR